MGKRRWLKDNILNIIQIAPIIVGVVVAVFAGLQGIAWYLIVAFLIILGVLAIPMTLLSINQLASWRERHKKKLTKLSDKELREKIREWIAISAWDVRTLDLADGVLAAYNITAGRASVHIERQAKDPLVIILVTQMPTNPNKMVISETDWERLGGRVSIEMARLGIEFRFIGSSNPLERIQLIDTVILDDALTGYYFRSRVMFIIRAMILVLEISKDFLRQISERSVPDKGDSSS